LKGYENFYQKNSLIYSSMPLRTHKIISPVPVRIRPKADRIPRFSGLPPHSIGAFRVSKSIWINNRENIPIVLRQGSSIFTPQNFVDNPGGSGAGYPLASVDI
jgi:hypothetical protein